MQDDCSSAAEAAARSRVATSFVSKDMSICVLPTEDIASCTWQQWYFLHRQLNSVPSALSRLFTVLSLELEIPMVSSAVLNYFELTAKPGASITNAALMSTLTQLTSHSRL